MASYSPTDSYGLGYFVPLEIGDTDNWRVPMKVISDSYHVYVSPTAERIYSDATLPDLLRVKLTMLKAKGDIPRLFDAPTWDLYRFTLAYEVWTDAEKFNENLFGWRVTSDLYMLILTSEELSSLQGEQLNRREHGNA
jgi:hypothetical protein